MALTEVCKGRDNTGSHMTGKKSETKNASNIQNSSISNSINSSSSSNKSNSTSRSGATSISGVKTYQQLKKELFDWFKISRGPTLQKISQDDLFESAVLFFRNSRIRNPEAKIDRDRLLLDQIIDDINSNRYFEIFKNFLNFFLRPVEISFDNSELGRHTIHWKLQMMSMIF